MKTKYCYRCSQEKSTFNFKRVTKRDGTYLRRSQICEECEEKLNKLLKKPRKAPVTRRDRELALIENPFKAPKTEISSPPFFSMGEF